MCSGLQASIFDVTATCMTGYNTFSSSSESPVRILTNIYLERDAFSSLHS